MSHLVVRKTKDGKYGIWDKNKQSFVGKSGNSREEVVDIANERDKKEDKK